MLPFLRRLFGTRAERAAARYLRQNGVRIVERNVQLPGGELDLVGVSGRVIVFVEVRSTAGTDLERPTLSVDAEKQRRVTRLALIYLQRHNLLGQMCRFDIVAVSWPSNAKAPEIEHHPHAFEASGSGW